MTNQNLDDPIRLSGANRRGLLQAPVGESCACTAARRYKCMTWLKQSSTVRSSVGGRCYRFVASLKR